MRGHLTTSSCRAGAALLTQMPAVLKPCAARVPCRKRRSVAGRPRSKLELVMEDEKRAAAEKAARQQAGSMHKRSALDLPHDLVCCWAVQPPKRCHRSRLPWAVQGADWLDCNCLQGFLAETGLGC